MQKYTYTFDTDGHTVVTPVKESDPLNGLPFYLKPLFRFMIWAYSALAMRLRE